MKKTQVEVNRPEIFKYFDYRAFLLDLYNFKKALNSKFSYNGVARKIGLSKPHLHMILSNKRNLVEAKVLLTAKAFGLNDAESQYFHALVQWNQCQEVEAKEMFWGKLLEKAPRDDFFTLETMEKRILTKWYVLALLSMFRLKGFKNDPKWISEKFFGLMSIYEAKQTMDMLVKLDYIEIKNGQVKLLKEDREFVRTYDAEVIKKVHAKNIPLGVKALDEIAPEYREFGTSSVPLRFEDVKKVKAKIQELQSMIVELSSSIEEPEEVFQLNVQFFPLKGRSH